MIATRIRLGDGKREDVMTYNAVVEAIDRQIERENAMSDEERLWIYKEVKAHQKMKNSQACEVLMQWEGDSETWEPLTEIVKTALVTGATRGVGYCVAKQLLSRIPTLRGYLTTRSVILGF